MRNLLYTIQGYIFCQKKIQGYISKSNSIREVPRPEVLESNVVHVKFTTLSLDLIKINKKYKINNVMLSCWTQGFA